MKIFTVEKENAFLKQSYVAGAEVIAHFISAEFEILTMIHREIQIQKET